MQPSESNGLNLLLTDLTDLTDDRRLFPYL